MHAFDYYPIYFSVPIAFIDHNSSQNRVKKEDKQEIDVYKIAYSKVLQNLCIVPNYIMGIGFDKVMHYAEQTRAISIVHVSARSKEIMHRHNLKVELTLYLKLCQGLK